MSGAGVRPRLRVAEWIIASSVFHFVISTLLTWRVLGAIGGLGLGETWLGFFAAAFLADVPRILLAGAIYFVLGRVIAVPVLHLAAPALLLSWSFDLGLQFMTGHAAILPLPWWLGRGLGFGAAVLLAWRAAPAFSVPAAPPE